MDNAGRGRSRPKRKRLEKKTLKEEQNANQTLTAATLEKGELSIDIGQRDIPLVRCSQNVRSKAIFVLDNASLQKGLVRKEWKILNSDDDAQLLLNQRKNLNDYRPDIVHEALRSILDSPLNKAGMVAAIYVKIDKGLLFEVRPHVRLPRTCKRFCGVILELLQKSRVYAKDTNEVLLRVLEEPVTRHLPVNSHIIGLSYNSERLVDIEDYVSAMDYAVSPVYVVGAMVNGSVKKDYMHDYISVSGYPLSAKCCIGLICEAMEQKWNIF
ncbi:ribosomal RNA small subunit methyltransferase NEP1-like isoform X2 [Neltuma alba]|uniref:ribosomal RNA small subunit methyltransferase NEP1-like isoform X2 n=1 Tax=Neltuma alba TaxID=207710 RepID=UPI0010A45409|nr:ribosomal RNA small subunit methyltransferase NEP1-like isoform X2 [Prosopis alba]